MDNELLGLLGLARKAGKLALGEESAADAALAHKARLILIAADAADNTAQRIRRAAGEGNAPCFSTGFSKARLGGAVGLNTCAVAAVTDVGLAAAAMKKLALADPQTYGETAEALSKKAVKTNRRRKEKLQRQKAEKRAAPWAPPPKAPKE